MIIKAYKHLIGVMFKNNITEVKSIIITIFINNVNIYSFLSSFHQVAEFVSGEAVLDDWLKQKGLKIRLSELPGLLLYVGKEHNK
ncbi:Uncharacterised protein [Escherichia coli]|uniref:Uncharacterized protein n=1 Tax=Escherichia coli TaxID=562 RepID=A0A2X1KS95_ECOLX|nr:Uncharacterised protein [Escherichia coli]